MPNAESPTDAARLTRRDVLQRAGWMVAGASITAPQIDGGQAETLLAAAQAPAVTASQTAADLPVSDVMMRLSTYMSEARNRALPDEVLERTKRHVLDTCAAMVSGSEL